MPESNEDKDLGSLRISKSERKQGQDKGGMKSGNSRACFQCGEVGHLKVDCPLVRFGKSDLVDKTKWESSGFVCGFCGKKGHAMITCWSFKPERKKITPTCMYCGEEGHFMIDCTKYSDSLRVGSKGKLN